MNAPRPWYAVDLLKTCTVIAILSVLMAAFALLYYRHFLANQPAIGGAVPIEELRAVWAEDARDLAADDAKTPPPVTLPTPPRPRPEGER